MYSSCGRQPGRSHVRGVLASEATVASEALLEGGEGPAVGAAGAARGAPRTIRRAAIDRPPPLAAHSLAHAHDST